MGIAGGYGIISYKKVNILKTTKGQLAKRLPLWREGKVRKLCLLSANSYGIWDGVKQNVFFLQRVRMQKLINGSMQNVSRSGEKGGPFALANGGK